MKLAAFPLSAFAGRLPVVSQGIRGDRHKGVDIDFRAIASDPPWSGKNDEQRTKNCYFPPPGVVVVRAAAPGIVSISHQRSNGGSVRIAHPGQLSTLYLHLAQRLVDVGDEVAAGQAIGTAGVPGPGQFGHLHFEVRGPGETPRDPVPLLDGATVFDNAGGRVGPFAPSRRATPAARSDTWLVATLGLGMMLLLAKRSTR